MLQIKSETSYSVQIFYDHIVKGVKGNPDRVQQIHIFCSNLAGYFSPNHPEPGPLLRHDHTIDLEDESIHYYDRAVKYIKFTSPNENNIVALIPKLEQFLSTLDNIKYWQDEKTWIHK